MATAVAGWFFGGFSTRVISSCSGWSCVNDCGVSPAGLPCNIGTAGCVPMQFQTNTAARAHRAATTQKMSGCAHKRACALPRRAQVTPGPQAAPALVAAGPEAAPSQVAQSAGLGAQESGFQAFQQQQEQQQAVQQQQQAQQQQVVVQQQQQQQGQGQQAAGRRRLRASAAATLCTSCNGGGVGAGGPPGRRSP